MTEEKKGWWSTQKVIIVVILVIAITCLFSVMEEGRPNIVVESEPEPVIEYEPVSLQVIKFDTDEEYFDSIWTECYEVVDIPNDAIQICVGVTWEGGDKDSYVKLTFWEWGEIDDTNIGELYENSKKGKAMWNKNISPGEIPKFYVEASIINDLSGTIAVMAVVPK